MASVTGNAFKLCDQSAYATPTGAALETGATAPIHEPGRQSLTRRWRGVPLAPSEGTPAGYYLSGVLVEPAWRGRGIAAALTRARLRWALAHAGTVFNVTGADNAASLHLHAALGFREVNRFASERSAAGLDVLSQLVRTAAFPYVGPFTGRR